MFDVTLIHVPATKFRGPDALSWRIPGDNEEISTDNDEWLDNIALFAELSPKSIRLNPQMLPLVIVSTKLDQQLQQIIYFLKSLEIPSEFYKPNAKNRFIQKASCFFLCKDQQIGNPGEMDLDLLYS